MHTILYSVNCMVHYENDSLIPQNLFFLSQGVLPKTGKATTCHLLIKYQGHGLTQIPVKDVEGLVGKNIGMEQGAISTPEK